MKKTDIITVPITDEIKAREAAAELFEFNGCTAYTISGVRKDDNKYSVIVSYDSKHHKKMEELMSSDDKQDIFTILAATSEEAILKAQEQLQFLCVDSPRIIGVSKENGKYLVSVAYNSKQYNKSINTARKTNASTTDNSGATLRFKPYL